ncbi:GNAT family N-acetyltransferase [Desulfobulbus oligotrophicus]|uniref:GNAT family N-acetyltransferase n=1 Tax=Desulfobulbus oligotrophicus TaxID=1909699 RepID=A0A7T5VB90_9BACT|nr:GNAT family N-acetyltransferase [Desulfobulbus oligotrophicus]QQG64709.1 GNAT family N-acetyltransferase [Desulfobulbus oligotrophicus]
MSGKLSVEQLNQDRLPDIWPICTTLAQAMAYPSFFCTGDWLAAVSSGLTSSERPVVLQVKEKDRVIAVLPLVSTANILGGRDLHYLGAAFYPDPLGLICAPDDRGRAVTAIKQHLGSDSHWDRLVLSFILEDELEAWGMPKNQVSVQPYISLDTDFEGVFGQLGSKSRSNIRKKYRRIVKGGGEFIVAVDVDSKQKLLDALLHLHAKRSGERKLESTFAGPHVEHLHRWLVTHSDNSVFYAIVVQDKLIAIQYGFEFGQRFFAYQIAHDPAFGHWSPGAVLVMHVLEACCTKGLQEFNFLQGDEGYKSTWTTEARPLYQLVIYQRNWRAGLRQGGQRAKTMLRKIVRYRQGGS